MVVEAADVHGFPDVHVQHQHTQPTQGQQANQQQTEIKIRTKQTIQRRQFDKIHIDHRQHPHVVGRDGRPIDPVIVVHLGKDLQKTVGKEGHIEKRTIEKKNIEKRIIE